MITIAWKGIEMSIPTMEELRLDYQRDEAEGVVPEGVCFDLEVAFYHGYMAALNTLAGHDEAMRNPAILRFITFLTDRANDDMAVECGCDE
jgi:hypothetical protein